MLLVPAGVVRVTVAVPAAPAGAMATTWLSEMTVNAAVALPNSAVVVWARLVPVIVTVLPPVMGPWVGLSPVRVGAGR